MAVGGGGITRGEGVLAAFTAAMRRGGGVEGWLAGGGEGIGTGAAGVAAVG